MPAFVAFLALALLATQALAHGGAAHAGKAGRTVAEATQQPYGVAGDPRRARRTIAVEMTDAMRFEPSRIDVRRGETLRIVVRNRGHRMHEMVLGTMADLQEHAALMRKFPDMEHDEPHMAHVPPGGSGQIVWRFNRPGEFNFACLVAGHMEAGMLGTIAVK